MEKISIEKMIKIMHSKNTQNWIEKFITNHYGDSNLSDELSTTFWACFCLSTSSKGTIGIEVFCETF